MPLHTAFDLARESSGWTVSKVTDNSSVELEVPADENFAHRAALDDLIFRMSEMIERDGGVLRLRSVDMADGIVEVELSGACSSCALSTETLRGGVERILLDRLEWVREVRSFVDDSLGFEDSFELGRGGYVPRF